MQLIDGLLTTDVFQLLIWVVLLIVADTVLGVCVALKHRAFEWEAFPDFLAANVVPYIGGLAILGLLALVPGHPEMKAAFMAATVPVAALFGKSIVEKVADITGIRPLEKYSDVVDPHG